METRRLGKSGLDVPVVTFGAWAIGGRGWGGRDDAAAADALRAALELGTCAIDTAPVYGFGHSERLVGEAIRGRRDEVLIFTKAGLRWDDDRAAVNAALAEVVAPVAHAHDATIGQVSLAWLLTQPGVTSVLAGARTAEQVRENVGAGALALTADEVAAIDRAFAELALDMTSRA